LALNLIFAKVWEAAMDIMNETIIIFDEQYRRIYCNKQDSDFWVTEEELNPLLESTFNSGQITKKLINQRWEVDFLPVLLPKSRFICTVVRDTDIQGTAVQLFKARQRDLEAIIQSSYDGIGIIDRDGTLLAVNNSYLRITGLSEEESGVGRKVQDLEKEGHVSKAVGVMVLEKKKAVTIKQKIKTGKEVLITGSPVFDDQGEIIRIVANIRDMTELNMLKEEIEKSKDLSVRYFNELKELRAYRWAAENIVANSQAMKKVVETAVRVAGVDATVLITGESGVGKEVIAKEIHKASQQKNGPFITINCGAIPENLLESELFGYEKGAFTGANREGKIGIFQAAHNGTLMLDEIGEMPLGLQVKLLRAIQEREILPVGGTKPLKVNVRILALTNRNLKNMVREGAFREDLYYRLNVVSLYIPPLRERREDIIVLAMAFMKKFNEKYNFNKRLQADVLKAFEQYNWPGNVRELETTIESLLVTTDDDEIKAFHLPEAFQIGISSREGFPCDKLHINIESLLPLKEAVELLEKRLLARAINQCGSSRQAARILGVDHSTVVRKAQKYEIKW
jgi:PAS domain S-box-containing protein